MQSDREVAANVIKGAVAGAAATWVMSQLTTLLYNRENHAAREMEDRARNGRTAYGIAAEEVAHAGGVDLTNRQRHAAGQAIHWALGIAAGAAYGVIRRERPGTASMKGIPFGAAFFLLFDELLNPALGLTPGPEAFPWQAHARGMAGHLAFGATTELLLEGLDRVA